MNLLSKYHIDNSWTLFLDRDGVINRKLDNDYVKKWSEFEFLPGVLEAIYHFSLIFGRIVVVTNQQGIGKGIYTHEDLSVIHSNMLSEIFVTGGRIDKVYYCPNLVSDNAMDRKPNTGMALKAKKDFPEIEFKKSIMIGDSLSDMEFGKKLEMVTCYITTRVKMDSEKMHLIDYTAESLSMVKFNS